MASSSSLSGLGDMQPGGVALARDDPMRIIGDWISSSISFSRDLMTLGKNAENNLAALNQLNTEDSERVFRFSSEYLALSGKQGIVRWTYLPQAVDLLARGELALDR